MMRVYYGTTDIRRWQNYSFGNKLRKNYGDTKKYKFMPFDITSGTETGLISVDSLSFQIPATPDNVFVFSYALEQGYLIEVETFKFDASLGDDLTDLLPVARKLASSYTGQVKSVESDLNLLQIEIGSSEMAVTASVPPRIYNNYLVGIPYKP